MNKIDTTNWQDFAIKDIFYKCKLKCTKKTFNKALDISETKTEEFDLPLVNAKHSNNGIMYYGRVLDFESEEMTIDIVADGAASTGDIYAQPQRTGVLYNAYLIKLKYNSTKNILLSLATIMKSAIKHKFGYENKCTWEKIRNLKIPLPIKAENTPDFEFLEIYMQNIMEKARENIVNLTNIDKQYKKCINTAMWKSFSIGELFKIYRPNSRSSKLYNEGNIPFVASGSFNNGVCGYFKPKNENDFDLGNCITVSPVDGYAFYQKNKFLGRGGAGSSIIILRNANLNEYIGKYICSIIRKVCNDWSYSNMGNKDKLKDTIINLPVTTDGSPDWKYIENYMKNIEVQAQKNISLLKKGIL